MAECGSQSLRSRLEHGFLAKHLTRALFSEERAPPSGGFAESLIQEALRPFTIRFTVLLLGRSGGLVQTDLEVLRYKPL